MVAVMGVVGKPVFSFGELLVLIDVEGVGAMSAPLPTPLEASGLTGMVCAGAHHASSSTAYAGSARDSRISTLHPAPISW